MVIILPRHRFQTVLHYFKQNYFSANEASKLFHDIPIDTLFAIHHQIAIKNAKYAGIQISRARYSESYFWESYRHLLLSQLFAYNDLNFDDKQLKMLPIFILKEMAEQYRQSPCQMARLVIKSFIESILTESYARSYTSSPNNWISNPELIPQRELASFIYSDGDRIAFLHLIRELWLCLESDTLFSPLMDNYRLELGKQKEALLHLFLDSQSIPYMNEDTLKKLGYPKTPDALLPAPICIQIKGSDVWHPLNWFESKALFADSEQHHEYMRTQLIPYYNRFGPGLVVYWFGHVEGLQEYSSKLKDRLNCWDIIVLPGLELISNIWKF